MTVTASPKVSVVVPTLNRLALLQETLATLLAQDEPDLEITKGVVATNHPGGTSTTATSGLRLRSSAPTSSSKTLASILAIRSAGSSG